MSEVRALRRTFVLHASLEELPEIWRRFTLPSDTLLGELHACLQILFDWEDQHLHYFERAGMRYGIPADDENRLLDQGGVRVSQVLAEAGDSLRYVYDFGDRWAHRIELQAVRPFEAADVRPRCLDGARAGPPEDCGGSKGYRHLLTVLATPGHPERDDMVAWLNGFYHPNAFSTADVNDRLKRFLVARRR